MHERSAAGKVQGTWNESFMVRSVQGTNSLENKSSSERMVQGTNVPRNEWSRERKFHHGNKCSRERIVLGTNIPDTANSSRCFGYSSAHCTCLLCPRLYVGALSDDVRLTSVYQYQDFSLPSIFAPRSERSQWELLFQGANVPRNFCSWE